MSDHVDDAHEDIFLDDTAAFDSGATSIPPELLDEPIGMEPESFSSDDVLMEDGGVETEITDETSALASAPGKNILILGILGIAALFIIFKFVFVEDKKADLKEEMDKITASQPVSDAINATRPEGGSDLEIGSIDIQELPDVPLVEAPEIDFSSAPDPSGDIEPFAGFEPGFLDELENIDDITSAPAPLAYPSANNVPIAPTSAPIQAPIQQQQFSAPPLTAAPPVVSGPIDAPLQPIEPSGPSASEIASRRAAIRKSNGFVVNSGQGLPSSQIFLRVDETGKPITSNVELSHTGSQQVTATNIGETDFIIAQGKIIEAVLETAIHTALPGMLRAVVTRDIYAESGTHILIPKGSRLIGTYNDNIDDGDTRIAIQWQRVIRPDGIDIAINSPSTDSLGRAGTGGFVDTKIWSAISTAVLLSVISIGSTIALDSLDSTGGVNSSSTVNNDGSTTASQSGTPVDFAVLESVTDVSTVTERLTQDLLDEDPIIIVNQGTRINVFVNQDLVFPKNAVYGAHVVQ